MNRAFHKDPVDAFISGAGAFSAAVAWSSKELKMHILCVEQGDLTSSSDYFTNDKIFESQQTGAYNINLNVRSLDTDYPVWMPLSRDQTAINGRPDSCLL